ncbi:hypothetical protein NFI96_023156 [Prochilodus magdalenae]|nr:hypothetical protein NFI96_023156 [Prochilodus magdalenae]
MLAGNQTCMAYDQRSKAIDASPGSVCVFVGLLEEAEYLIHSLNNNEWKLLLLLVPVDELRFCPGQVSSAVDSAVHRVEQALDRLHGKLDRTLVHVVVWGGRADAELESHDGASQCQHEEELRAGTQSWHRLERATLVTVLQESLGALLQRRSWWSDREGFSVVLQSSPTYIHSSGSTNKIDDVTGSSHLTETVIQLWTKLLQSMETKPDLKGRGVASVPCPSQEMPYLLTQRNSPRRQLEGHKPSPSTEFQPTPFMGTNLSCANTSPSPSVPTSVHALRPADIKVVGALGDSLTAGNGVGAAPDNLLDVSTEYRGLAWRKKKKKKRTKIKRKKIRKKKMKKKNMKRKMKKMKKMKNYEDEDVGGDDTLSSVTTLPNILRLFNPSLTGFSTGEGKATSPQAFLNQAVAGATSEDLVTQARALITRMKDDSRIDFQNDWKVITVFIGGNDLCDYCTDPAYNSATNFANRIRDALDILHAEVPRALVNLVEVMYIVPLRKLHLDSSLGCPTWFISMICPCVVDPAEGSAELQALINMNREYQSATSDLVDSGRYNTRSDFTVVLQPFARDVVIPLLPDGRPDRSYFAPDCFHLSQKSQSLMARSLWNNMLEPVSSKTTSTDVQAGITAMCPSSSTHYLATSGNSESAVSSLHLYPPPVVIPVLHNWGSDFSCKSLAPSDTVPASVHKLRPGDINVVAAVGDSITAGFGAKATNLNELTIEERGVSWSIGGDGNLETVTTIPNILRKFNPNLFGFSEGSNKRPNGFNMAIGGTKAIGIPAQVKDLIDALRNSSKVDFEQDWKLVTLFIGGNDLCQYCLDKVGLSPAKFMAHLQDALDMLYNEVPRVLVNFVEVLEIEGLREVTSNTTGCSLQPILCPCLIIPEENSDELYEMKRINRELQTVTERLVYSGRYDERDDFAVVLQPFFRSSVVPMGEDKKPDLSFFSVDCFHFTERGHAEMAIALWNNMLEPVGSKQSYNNFTHDRSKIKCPSEESPFFFTRVNSLTAEVPTTPSSSEDSVPTWAAAVLAVGGLLIGVAITWMGNQTCTAYDQRSKAIDACVSEVLSGFNPAVTALLPEQSGLLEEAEYLIHSLNNKEWKLLLLLVPVDELRYCPGQVSSAVDSAVHRVEQALDRLHGKLDRTLVHVVVWGGRADAELESHDGASQCQHEEELRARTQSWHRLERATLVTVLQESLGALLQRRSWWSEREGFSVVLQSSPTYIHSSGSANKIDDVTGSSHLTETVIQLWTKLLQSMETKPDLKGKGVASVPCPSQEMPYLLTQRNSPRRQLEGHKPSPSTEFQPTPFMGTSLSCANTSPSPSVPTSVHALRPADIKVVGALGDSLTASNGAGSPPDNLLDVLTEYRGLAWRKKKKKKKEKKKKTRVKKKKKKKTRVKKEKKTRVKKKKKKKTRVKKEKKKTRVKKKKKKKKKKKTRVKKKKTRVKKKKKTRVKKKKEKKKTRVRKKTRVKRKKTRLKKKKKTRVKKKKKKKKKTRVKKKKKKKKKKTRVKKKMRVKKKEKKKTRVKKTRVKKKKKTRVKKKKKTRVKKKKKKTRVKKKKKKTRVKKKKKKKKKTRGKKKKKTRVKRKKERKKRKEKMEWKMKRNVGGDDTLSSVTTLPNILRLFNPSLTGFSTGEGKATSPQAFLNQAVAGATSEDLVTQARALITRMKDDSRIDFQNDWKVITVFIGGNDLCDYCTDPAYNSATNFANRIRDALDILHAEVPRALVNLVEVMYIVPLRKLHLDSSLGCPTWLISMICPCVVDPAEGSAELQALINMNREYQSATSDLVNSGRYNTRSDFTVVLQPFARDVVIPLLSDGRPDRSYFAPDCFHLSQKSHSLMARSLWNNMLEPVSSKTTSIDLQAGVTAMCPSSSTHYLATSGNSKSSYVATPVALPPVSSLHLYPPPVVIPVLHNWGSDFSCKSLAPSDTVPASVHKLRPGDINVVAAVGDSITAGFGAKATNLLELPIEERGVSWSIGGDGSLETVTTIPNILRKFNPNLFGFSEGSNKRPNGFNMAISGAKAGGIPGQMKELIDALRNSSKVDFEQDWKLVTLFIGGNDLCQYCNDKVGLSPAKFMGHLQDALDMLYNEVPRVLVNLVEILEIEGLREVTSNGTGCFLQPTLCRCFIRPEENSDELYEMKRINRELQLEHPHTVPADGAVGVEVEGHQAFWTCDDEPFISVLTTVPPHTDSLGVSTKTKAGLTVTERLVYSGRYDERDDFAVVLQPFFRSSVVPMGEDKKPDLSFFSVDCFHFTERGHAEMAIALWNNMLEPVGSKQSYNNFTHDRSKIKCPSEESPFIFTRVNSLTAEVPTTPSNSEDSVPTWAAAVLAVAGLLIGVAITWMVMYYRERRKKKNQKRNSQPGHGEKI